MMVHTRAEVSWIKSAISNCKLISDDLQLASHIFEGRKQVKIEMLRLIGPRDRDDRMIHRFHSVHTFGDTICFAIINSKTLNRFNR